jgi:lipopolysaccharide export system permease protein
MPLLWRYLLTQFLKVFFLCVVTFIAILLTMRLDEIAYFATLGPQGLYVLWFTLQQIPYILPIALPVSALISSMLLLQRLSSSHELTAMRASGFALRDIVAPILTAALFLSALNFYIISEMSTASHLSTGTLKNELRSINPLLLLQNKHVMRMKGFYFDTIGPTRAGEFAEDAIFVGANKHGDRLNFLVAKRLEASPPAFNGQKVTMLTAMPARSSDPKLKAEHLMVENIDQMAMNTKDFSYAIEKKIWAVNNDHLRMRQLLVRLAERHQELGQAQALGYGRDELKQLRHLCYRCNIEIIRRISVALAVFSFTLMGIAFGMHVGRKRSATGTIVVMGLSTLYLAAFFTAKGMEHALIAAGLLYLLPHVVIIAASLWMLRKVSLGKE